MKGMPFRLAGTVVAGALVLVLSGCSDDGDDVVGGQSTAIALSNRSVTPNLVKSLIAGVEIFSVISSDDVLPASPGFVFGGSADGAGLLKNTDGTFTLLTNHEDNFAISRVTLDATFKPIRGDYVVNSTAGKYRLCSATMVTPAVHGFGPLFLSAGESSEESQILGVNPTGLPNTPTYLTGFGRWNTENAVPLPSAAFANRTVVMLGDDDSGAEGGQLAMYVSSVVGDLEGGKLYTMARTNDVTRERDMVVGQSYPVAFREIQNHKTLTGRQINQVTATLKSIAFGRVEDIDYRKGGTGREIYFAVTGQNNTGVNANSDRTKYGRVYRVTLSAADPLSGSLELVLDGDDRTGPASLFQNPDNVVVGQNFLYVQEDDNGYGDEAHDAYVYQYNIVTKAIRPVLQLDHRRTQADAAVYNASNARPEGKAGWEYGAMVDVSAETGNADTFLLALQPHSWRGTKYVGVDGGTLRPAENQASQMVLVKGLPR